MLQFGRRTLPGVRALSVHQAVNLRLRGEPDRGGASQRPRCGPACETAIAVGNAETGEEPFASVQPGQLNHLRKLLSIRVGRVPSSRARYRRQGQPGIDVLLTAWLTRRGLLSEAAHPRYRA